MISLLSSWATTISLVFGGCCANALTLEQLTLTNPNIGSLITFLQFVLISLHGIPKHIMWTRYGPRFKPRQVPLLPYLGQVSLFYLISLLNNAAFAYRIPMPVHIIFRSGGLVVSMVLGWTISKKRYNVAQVFAVLMVTAGVALTTLSASNTSSSASATPSDPYIYATGIAILSVALILSGLLGLLQDWTYSKYRRPAPTSSEQKAPRSAPPTTTWQESMFYLHFLGLPMFLPLFADIKQQVLRINYDAPRNFLKAPIPSILNTSIPPPYSLPVLLKDNSFLYSTPDHLVLSVPTPYLPLLLNTITQLLCVAGVNRLTTRVNALTVTLILVVRKAISLVISLKGRAIVDATLGAFGNIDYGYAARVLDPLGGIIRTLLGLDVELQKVKQPVEVNEAMLWSGAGLVLLGTIMYSIGTGRSKKLLGGKKAKKE